MSIKALVQERESIEAEIKSLNIRKAKLREKLVKVNDGIKDFFEKKDQPGCKYNGYAIIINKKEIPSKKTKKQQQDDIKKVLSSYGIENTDKALVDILEAKKGKPEPTTKIEFKKLKPNK